MAQGIRDYSVYVMENDTNLYEWQSHTPETSAFFVGEVGSTYKFYSIATDNVSHEEDEPGQYDTQTTITVDVKSFELVKDELTVYPNPAVDVLRITLTNAPCGMYVVELLGYKWFVKTFGNIRRFQLAGWNKHQCQQF